jgi:DNA-binding NarL/FixJ family response regulator
VDPGTEVSNCDMTETKPIRILIADDHWILRQSLRAILETRIGFEVVGEAGNGQVAIEKVQEVCPDVVLMDDRMPVLGGIEATRRIKKINQKIIVIGLSNQSDKRYIQQMIDAGATDYLFKSASPSEIEASIRNAFSKSGN